MGIFSNMDNKKRYCVFCGKELADENAQPVGGKQKRWFHFLP